MHVGSTGVDGSSGGDSLARSREKAWRDGMVMPWRNGLYRESGSIGIEDRGAELVADIRLCTFSFACRPPPLLPHDSGDEPVETLGSRVSAVLGAL